MSRFVNSRKLGITKVLGDETRRQGWLPLSARSRTHATIDNEPLANFAGAASTRTDYDDRLACLPFAAPTMVARRPPRSYPGGCALISGVGRFLPHVSLAPAGSAAYLHRRLDRIRRESSHLAACLCRSPRARCHGTHGPDVTES